MLVCRVERVNPFMPSRLLYINSLDRSNSNKRGVWYRFSLLSCFTKIPVFNANSVDPDQTPRFKVSDLGLHSFAMSHLLDAMHHENMPI